MTTIVTADKLITALTARVNASADATVAGSPNNQLKSAMTTKKYFEGITGGGSGSGISMDFAHGGMYHGTLFEQARQAQMISQAAFDAYSDNNRDNPNTPAYKNYRWDAVSGPNSLGSWVDNTRFVFAKKAFVIITARFNLLSSVPAGQRIHNLTSNLVRGTVGGGGVFTGAVVDRNYHQTESPELGISSGSTTYSRWFDVNEYIEAKYLMCTSYGTANLAYYGSMRNIESAIEIAAFTGFQ